MAGNVTPIHFYKMKRCFFDTKIVTSGTVSHLKETLDAEMINKIKLDGVPLDAIRFRKSRL
jgi:starch synthase